MSHIQSVLFDKNYWDIFDSINWLHYHHLYPIKSPHITKKFIRYRIKDPKYFRRLRTIKTKDHLDIIVGFL